MVCLGSVEDRGKGKHIATAAAGSDTRLEAHTHLETHPGSLRHAFTKCSHTHRETLTNTQSPAGVRRCLSVWQDAGLSVTTAASATSHCVCSAYLKSGARSRGVTALIRHADRLANEKSSRHRSHTRWEQTLNNLLLCILLRLIHIPWKPLTSHIPVGWRKIRKKTWVKDDSNIS